MVHIRHAMSCSTPWRVPVISEKWNIHYASSLAVFNLLHSSTNQKLFESTSVNQSSHNEKIWTISITKGGHHVLLPNRLLLLAKINGAQDAGKFMKNTLYLLMYANRHLAGWSDVRQWKNQARSLSHYQVTATPSNKALETAVFVLAMAHTQHTSSKCLPTFCDHPNLKALFSAMTSICTCVHH